MSEQTETPEPEPLKICPLCAGEICRVEITTVCGKRAFSLCCDAPLEIIDNWDVFGALPGNLQQVALERIKAMYAEMDAADLENARRFKENDERWRTQIEHLFKGSPKIVPMHE